MLQDKSKNECVSPKSSWKISILDRFFFQNGGKNRRKNRNANEQKRKFKMKGNGASEMNPIAI